MTNDEMLAHKMDAVARLASGIAHDVNNLLTTVMGYGELLLDDMDDSDPHRADVCEIVKAGDTAAGLMRGLLALSRRQALQPEVVCLSDVVAEAVGSLQPIVGERIAIVSTSEPALGPTKVDPQQIHVVLENLASNARDAMPTGGTLTIGTSNDGPSRVCLTVADTGCGMTPDVQAHLFEPFFTTKPRGKGKGLGLAVVYGIVRQSGGSISVASRVGQGTMVTISLPVHGA